MRPEGGRTRLLNTDHIAEYNIVADAQHNYSLQAMSISAHYNLIDLAKSNNEGQIKSLLSQLIRMNSQSNGDMIVEIKEYNVEPVMLQ